MVKLRDITGRTFGRLTVLACDPLRTRGRVAWLCRCSCGRTKTVVGHELVGGNTRSCGCLLTEHVRKLRREYTGPRHVTHGGSHTPEYSVWYDMKRRCNQPQNHGYKHYGGRGIQVCERWRDFSAFYADMGPRPGPEYTIERLDNDRGYEPANCVWIHRSQQARNTRKNRYLTHNGRTQTLFEWAREIGISPAGLCTRLNRNGWSVEEALTRPVQQRRT